VRVAALVNQRHGECFASTLMRSVVAAIVLIGLAAALGCAGTKTSTTEITSATVDREVEPFAKRGQQCDVFSGCTPELPAEPFATRGQNCPAFSGCINADAGTEDQAPAPPRY
jgi:hypothetical protein